MTTEFTYHTASAELHPDVQHFWKLSRLECKLDPFRPTCKYCHQAWHDGAFDDYAFGISPERRDIHDAGLMRARRCAAFEVLQAVAERDLSALRGASERLLHLDMNHGNTRETWAKGVTLRWGLPGCYMPGPLAPESWESRERWRAIESMMVQYIGTHLQIDAERSGGPLTRAVMSEETAAEAARVAAFEADYARRKAERMAAGAAY